MKALILKELRENLKVAAIALLLSVLVVGGTQISYIKLIHEIASEVGSAGEYSARLQPLISGDFISFSGFLCGLAGVVLGWFQIHNERHRDLWAFLVHRPMTRTDIFFSKVIAGLFIYTMTVGLPQAYFILWVSMPGHVAAPFEWGMALPIVAGFLSGVAWYFAGMLTSIRQARWYGSRGLGLVAALAATVTAYKGINFWLAILVIVILALAVWGAFQNRGQFQGQPEIAKAALTFSLTPGAGAAFFAIVVLVLSITIGLNVATTWPNYVMGRDGEIYKVTGGTESPQVMTLDGKPLKDPDTGRSIERNKFYRKFAVGGVSAVLSSKKIPGDGQMLDPFHLVVGNRHTLWYMISRTRRIDGYDVQTRRFIGSVGPDGFSASENGDGSGFVPNAQWQYAWYDSAKRIMASTNTIYLVDVENHEVKPLWTLIGDDTIAGGGSNGQGEIEESAVGAGTVVLTRHKIFFFHFSRGKLQPVWTTPFDYADEDYPIVTVYRLSDRSEFGYCVWTTPSPFAQLQRTDKLPTHVLWMGKDGEITKRADLPFLKPREGPRTAERILNALVPPAVQLTEPWLSNWPIKPKLDWHVIRLGFGWGIICVLGGIWLGVRYSFSVQRQAIWALFNLFFGIPGLLAFVAVQEWPARVRCASCNKLRVVENERCEHCGADFPHPKLTGTEIFEG